MNPDGTPGAYYSPGPNGEEEGELVGDEGVDNHSHGSHREGSVHQDQQQQEHNREQSIHSNHGGQQQQQQQQSNGHTQHQQHHQQQQTNYLPQQMSMTSSMPAPSQMLHTAMMGQLS